MTSDSCPPIYYTMYKVNNIYCLNLSPHFTCKACFLLLTHKITSLFLTSNSIIRFNKITNEIESYRSHPVAWRIAWRDEVNMTSFRCQRLLLDRNHILVTSDDKTEHKTYFRFCLFCSFCFVSIQYPVRNQRRNTITLEDYLASGHGYQAPVHKIAKAHGKILHIFFLEILLSLWYGYMNYKLIILQFINPLNGINSFSPPWEPQVVLARRYPKETSARKLTELGPQQTLWVAIDIEIVLRFCGQSWNEAHTRIYNHFKTRIIVFYQCAE